MKDYKKRTTPEREKEDPYNLVIHNNSMNIYLYVFFIKLNKP